MGDDIVIGDVKIPVKIVVENRMSHRFSIARKSAIVRLPMWYPAWQKKRTINQFREWVLEHYQSTPHNFDRFRIKKYTSGDTIEIIGIPYSLLIEEAAIQNCKGQIIRNQHIIKVHIPLTSNNKAELVTKVIKKIIAKAFKPQLEERLNYFAQHVVHVSYKNFRLKDSVSNWGSCSGKDNINISIRTLLLPLKMIDYILIHELCHLKEMNHGPKFWAHVQSAMPDYKHADTWINKNGKNYRF